MLFFKYEPAKNPVVKDRKKNTDSKKKETSESGSTSYISKTIVLDTPKSKRTTKRRSVKRTFKVMQKKQKEDGPYAKRTFYFGKKK
jgi:hypothetical protein